jgi:hypothetical protein
MKPVCEGDRLRIETFPVPGREKEHAFEVTAYNETTDGEIAARMQTSRPELFPPVDEHANVQPNEWEGPVTQRRTWDTVYRWEGVSVAAPDTVTEDNAHWKQVLEDDVPIYEQGERPPLHPAHVLRLVQLGYNNQFIGDNAVHGGSKAIIRSMLRIGDPVHILTVPVAKWDKKQNHWLTIYCAVRRDDEVCAEVYHTQIIKLRGAENYMTEKA